MKKLIFFAGLLAIIVSSCQNTTDDAALQSHESDVKEQLVTYSKDYEFFAEADPFVVGQPSQVLAHFTRLNNFKPLKDSKVVLSLVVGSKGIRQTVESPIRDGIYLFEITPVTSGKGQMTFNIESPDGDRTVTLNEVVVYDDDHTAIHKAEENLISDPNGIVFTKEQSWKVDFATMEVESVPFGEVIKTGALIQASQSDKSSVVARTGGIVSLPEDDFFEGTAVTKNEVLFVISGTGLAGENSHVRYIRARNNYEQSKANYDRMQALAEDRIITASDLLEAKTDFETNKVIYENLQQNFSEGEQIVKSPANGFINEIYVKNGEYVEAGKTLVDIARNESLVLKADVQQKYASSLNNIKTANIRLIHEKKSYSLEELNGSLSSYGRSANHDNYLIPVRFIIDNNKNFVPGSYAELYIIAEGGQDVIAVPDQALLEDEGKYFVIVQLTPELFEKREVSIGSTDGFRTVITKGILTGERIVSKGAILVKLSQASGALDPHAGHVH